MSPSGAFEIVVLFLFLLHAQPGEHAVPIFEGKGHSLLLSLMNNISMIEPASAVNMRGLVDTSDFAAYISVPQLNSPNHIFFWYTRPMQRLDRDCLLVWLGGDPGESSMTGFLYEHGPYNLSDSGKEFQKRELHWGQNFSVVYVDGFPGIGYSFKDPNTDAQSFTIDQVAANLKAFLQYFVQFYALSLDSLYIGGEGYAARYVVALAELILDDNDMSNNVNLSGLFLGEPLINTKKSLEANIHMMYEVGALSESQKDQHLQKIQEFANSASDSDHSSLSHMLSEMNPPVATTVVPKNFVTRETIDRNAIEDAMEVTKFKRKIHANRKLSFTSFNVDLFNNAGHSYFDNYDERLGTLMETLNVLVYTGDQSLYSYGVEKTLGEIVWTNQTRYLNATRMAMIDGSKFCGFYSSTGNLCRAILRGAGHRAAGEKPEVVLKLMSDFIRKNTSCWENVYDL